MFSSSPVQFQILRIAAVLELTGFGRTTLYNKSNPHSSQYDPSFPKRISLSPSGNGAVGYLKHEIEAWIESRMQARQTSLSDVDELASDDRPAPKKVEPLHLQLLKFIDTDRVKAR